MSTLTVSNLSGLSSLTVDDLNVDSNTFYVDSTNNRVGVGKTNPQYPLDVSGFIRGTAGLVAGPNVVNISMTYQSDNIFSNGLNIYKRGTTGDSTAAVTLGSEVGYHSFFAYNGSGYNRGAYVIVNTAEDMTTANGGMHYRILTAPIGSNAALERFRITSEGDIGIGNTAPAHKLRVEGTASVLGAATFSNTVAVTGDITVSKGLNANGSLGSDTQVLSSNGSSVYWADASSGEFTWQSYAPVNGAVSQNFTIPSGATEILVVFDGVIQTGTARPTIRLGDSGGIETSGYENVAVGSITDTDNTGFSLTGDDLGQHRGIAWLYKLADHKWSCTSLMHNYTERNQSFGIKSITTELTTVQVLSDDAGDDWDGGGTIYVGYK